MNDTTRRRAFAPAILAATLTAALMIPPTAASAATDPSDAESTLSAASAPIDSATAVELSAALAAETTDASATPRAGADIPDTPLGAHLSWFLAALASPADVDTQAIAERFDPAFIDAVGGAQALVDTIASLATLGPFTVDAVEESTGAIGALTTTPNGRFVMQLFTGPSGTIRSLLVQPFEEAPPQATSWDELAERVADTGSPTRLTVFDVSGKRTVVDHRFGDLAGAQPSGSMFKLFVLIAVTDAVDRGRLSWDDVLHVTDEVRSLPSGTYQDEPTGTPHTVRETALAMISVSDNTATDMLIAALGGTAAVEKAMKRAGVDRKQNRPMITTRQLFELGWGSGDLNERWRDANHGQRKKMLRAVDRAALTTTVGDVTTPVWQDGLDWFYTDRDLAAAHQRLRALSDTAAGEPLTEILGTNPGVDFGDDWDRVQFKGGSSIGVLGGSWLLERGSERYVVTIQFASTDIAVVPSPQRMTFLVADAAGLLAAE